MKKIRYSFLRNPKKILLFSFIMYSFLLICSSTESSPLKRLLFLPTRNSAKTSHDFIDAIRELWEQWKFYYRLNKNRHFKKCTNPSLNVHVNNKTNT
ncbi:MAG: hypothetical protein WBQ73_01895 [Candidatus Babeliales bacterium]